jgi:hypothetical protein
VLNDILSNDGQMRSIAWAIGAMTTAWIAYTAWTERAAVASAAAELAAAWPLAVAGGVVYALSQISDYEDKVTTSNNLLNKSMKETADDAGTHFNALKGTFDTFIVTVQYAWLSLKNLWEGLTKVGNDLLSGHFKDAWNDMANPDTEASRTWARIRQSYWYQSGGYNGGTSNTSTTPTKGAKGHTRKDYMGEWDAADPNKATVPGMYDPKASGAGGAAATAGADTAATITGGGVRHITINIPKFQDKTEIHTASFKESVAEAEEMLENMFLRIVNSAATALN